MSKNTLNRIISANAGSCDQKTDKSNNIRTKYFEINELNNGSVNALINFASIIDCYTQNESHLRTIGLDDIIHRTILNLILGPNQNDQEDLKSRRSTRSERSVDILCDKIKQFPGNVITLTEMEEITGLSSRSLQLAFKRRFGCSAREWQRKEHLKRARELLTDNNNNQSVKEISRQLGFVSPASFSRFYLATFGELPSQTSTNKKD